MASSGRYSKFPKVDRSIPAGAPAQNTIAQAIIPSLSAKEIVALISSERVSSPSHSRRSSPSRGSPCSQRWSNRQAFPFGLLSGTILME
jgi:hypothetical protein